MATDPSFIVGLDFGTTFSGIAWSIANGTDRVEVITRWPGGGNRNWMKVPSSILYDDFSTKWGYQTGTSTEAFRGFKLLLDENEETPYKPSLDTKKLFTKYEKDAFTVTADFLRRLVHHIKEILCQSNGISAQRLQTRFVLTVPAVWSDKAQNETLRAAQKSGIPAEDVTLISEPEAAALYTLRATQPHPIAVNDVFTVCDAGGGTVDLISYRIVRLEPLVLAEVVKGTGRVCGSILLDQGFQLLLEKKMGTRGYANLSARSKEIAMTYWQDRVKHSFAGNCDDDFEVADYFIPVPGACDNPKIPIEDGLFQLTSDDVAGIFAPVIRDIECLVAEQLNGIKAAKRSPKAIILVGGFGSSEFLYRRLKESNPGLTILQPPDAWSAIVSGAVLHGLDINHVESRIARRNYGVAYDTLYIHGVHESNEKYWDDLRERYKVQDRMKWYIKKFSKISENEPIKTPFIRTIRTIRVDHILFEDNLLFCNNDSPPDKKNKDCMRLCTLETDLSTVPRQLFHRKRTSKGVEYWEVQYELVITPTSATLLFELKFNGVAYGCVRAKY
ncbi:actin-like ATPase domain-containing protein [Aspergillus avenaceus]|uniref:Actin-like ATPase domain-containing protein n=1 Tax=Aspergillus avenaceus TaxID=36643 RepID=A0A5N6TZB9_ASPAV|nr:actin-like ATPase domain-containing protein [Aspergillus avenaceus]